MAPARRVLVVVNGGAGKSTLAAALGTRPGLPVVHLDRLYRRPGWTPMPRAEWLRRLEALTAADAWILDGNCRGTMAERLARADALVLLDPPTPLCLWRVARRIVRERVNRSNGRRPPHPPPRPPPPPPRRAPRTAPGC